jgi:hypothetical protein
VRDVRYPRVSLARVACTQEGIYNGAALAVVAVVSVRTSVRVSLRKGLDVIRYVR